MQRPRSAPLMSCRMRRLPKSIRSWSSSMIGFMALTRSSLLRDVLVARLDLEAAEWAVLACDAKIENHLDRKTIVRFQRVEISQPIKFDFRYSIRHDPLSSWSRHEPHRAPPA